ncbi:MAG: hypothetical protein ACSLE6_12250 [Mycobacterium sp.]
MAKVRFDVDRFVAAVEVVFTAMDISIAFGEFPTEKITEMSKTHRPLGIGYANLGALLMTRGLAYDSAEGRALAASITALMTGTAYRVSADLAGVVGPYAAYEANKNGHRRVMVKHRENAQALLEVLVGNLDARPFPLLDNEVHDVVAASEEASVIAGAALREWNHGIHLGDEIGWRNGQASLLAPTGTIGFMMDCDTTGIEPDFSLIKFKKLVGGGSMQIANKQTAPALQALGYAEEQVEAIVAYIAEHGHVIDAPALRPEHYPVFDTAAGVKGQISPDGHVNMLVAVQPFLSGAISKTVNLPETATVEDIKDVYMQSWKRGLKATAVYRDNCKTYQPLNDAKKVEASAQEVKSVVETVYAPTRKRLPKSRAARTTSFAVAGAEGYLTSGAHEDGSLGEIFLKLGKQGSTLAGVMDAFSIAVSIGLQYGVPLETYVSKFTNLRFEPSGFTDDEEVRSAQSLTDYVFRRLALDYMPFEQRAGMGIYTAAERTRYLETGSYTPIPQDEGEEAGNQTSARVEPVAAHPQPTRGAPASFDMPLCLVCGTPTVPAGSCTCCPSCGATTGCS